MAIDPNNPYFRPPAHRRAARSAAAAAGAAWHFTLAAPRAAYRQFRAAPLAVRAALLLLAAAGVGGLVYYAATRPERVRRTQTVIAWQEFETKAHNGADPDELLPILDRVLANNPTDPTAVRRRAALEAWSADPD